MNMEAKEAHSSVLPRLMHLVNCRNKYRPANNSYEWWCLYVAEFFAPNGIVRMSVKDIPLFQVQGSLNDTEVPFELLPRLFQRRFANGVMEELLFVGTTIDAPLPEGGALLLSYQASEHLVFDGYTLIQYGHLKAVFNDVNQLQLLEFAITGFDLHLDHSVISKDLLQLTKVLEGRTQQLSQLATNTPSANSVDTASLQAALQETAHFVRGIQGRLEQYLSFEFEYIQRTLRFMQLADVVNSMQEMIMACKDDNVSPIQAMWKFGKFSSQAHIWPREYEHMRGDTPPAMHPSQFRPGSSSQGPFGGAGPSAGPGPPMGSTPMAGQVPGIGLHDLQAESNGHVHPAPLPAMGHMDLPLSQSMVTGGVGSGSGVMVPNMSGMGPVAGPGGGTGHGHGHGHGHGQGPGPGAHMSGLPLPGLDLQPAPTRQPSPGLHTCQASLMADASAGLAPGPGSVVARTSSHNLGVQGSSMAMLGLGNVGGPGNGSFMAMGRSNSLMGGGGGNVMNLGMAGARGAGLGPSTDPTGGMSPSLGMQSGMLPGMRRSSMGVGRSMLVNGQLAMGGPSGPHAMGMGPQAPLLPGAGQPANQRFGSLGTLMSLRQGQQ